MGTQFPNKKKKRNGKVKPGFFFFFFCLSSAGISALLPAVLVQEKEDKKNEKADRQIRKAAEMQKKCNCICKKNEKIKENEKTRLSAYYTTPGVPFRNGINYGF